MTQIHVWAAGCIEPGDLKIFASQVRDVAYASNAELPLYVVCRRASQMEAVKETVPDWNGRIRFVKEHRMTQHYLKGGRDKPYTGPCVEQDWEKELEPEGVPIDTNVTQG